MTQITLDYYNTNANQFNESTRNVDFKATQTRFLNRLTPSSHILDFGCGSGRDTKYFLEQGYKVDAMDGSIELCKLATAYTGIEIQNKLFHELNAKEEYDAIWACSSILHLPIDELKEVMLKMAAAVKRGGIIYTSFKYGTFAGERNGRYFTDMTEETFAEFLQEFNTMANEERTNKTTSNKNITNRKSSNERLTIEEQWITSDVRPNRGEEQWLNLILRRN